MNISITPLFYSNDLRAQAPLDDAVNQYARLSSKPDQTEIKVGNVRCLWKGYKDFNKIFQNILQNLASFEKKPSRFQYLNGKKLDLPHASEIEATKEFVEHSSKAYQEVKKFKNEILRRIHSLKPLLHIPEAVTHAQNLEAILHDVQEIKLPPVLTFETAKEYISDVKQRLNLLNTHLAHLKDLSLASQEIQETNRQSQTIFANGQKFLSPSLIENIEVFNTELSILGSRYTWQGNTDFGPIFMNFLEQLEERVDAHSQKNSAASIQKAREAITNAKTLVKLASKTFQEVKSFTHEISSQLNTLRLQTQNEETKMQIQQLESLRQEIQKLALPPTLTKELVDQYVSSTSQGLMKLRGQFAQVTKRPEPPRQDVQAAEQQAQKILTTQVEELKQLQSEYEKVQDTLDQLLTEMKNSLSLFFEQFPEMEKMARHLIQEVTYLKEIANSEMTKDKASLKACCTSANALYTKLSQLYKTFKEQELKAQQQANREQEIAAEKRKSALMEDLQKKELQDKTAEIAAQIQKTYTFFVNGFDKLSKLESLEGTVMEDNFQDLKTLRLSFWSYQQDKCKKSTSIDELHKIEEEVKLQQDVDRAIIALLHSAIAASERNLKPMPGSVGLIQHALDALSHTALGLTNLGAILSTDPHPREIKVGMEALYSFIANDKHKNLRFFKELIEEKQYFENLGHRKVAEHYEFMIQKFKKAGDQICSDNKTLDTQSLETYIQLWNKQIDKFASHHDLFSRLKQAEENLSARWERAQERVTFLKTEGSHQAYELTKLLDQVNPNSLQIQREKLNDSNAIDEYIENMNHFINKIDSLLV